MNACMLSLLFLNFCKAAFMTTCVQVFPLRLLVKCACMKGSSNSFFNVYELPIHQHDLSRIPLDPSWTARSLPPLYQLQGANRKQHQQPRTFTSYFFLDISTQKIHNVYCFEYFIIYICVCVHMHDCLNETLNSC